MQMVLLLGLRRLVSAFSSGFLLSQMGWAEGGDCLQLIPGVSPQRRRALGSGLLLGEDPPKSQHYSSERYVCLPQAARQAGQELGSTLILPSGQDLPPLHLGEGCRCTSTASLTRSP